MIAWQYALRQLQRRVGRSLLSLLSVVIAVAAIVAVTSATATTRLAYQQVFEALAGHADLEVTARGGSHFAEPIAEQLRGIPGIHTALPVFHRATIVYAHGRKTKALAVGILNDVPESTSDYRVLRGQLPTRPGQIALEANLAEALQIQAGERVRLLTSRGLRGYEVTGLVQLESAARLRQGGMVLAPMAPLQRDFRSTGSIDALELYLDAPKRPADAIAAAQKALPPELIVQVPSSRSGLAEETLLLTNVSLNMASGLSFTTAIFIVLSIFIMNVGERRAQLSIMRAIGATRRQILGIITFEALLTGLLGTLIGIPIGIYGSSFLIRTMGNLLNTSLPETPDLRWAFGVGAIMGPFICLIGAWYPARRASQISPLEGMRPAVSIGRRGGYRRATAAGVVGLSFAILTGLAAERGDVPPSAAVVALIASLVSLVLLLPAALRPAVNLIAYPLLRFLGVEGEMSQRIVLRRVGRSALTIGVLFISVAAAVGTGNAVFSITDDVRNWYEQTITADFLLRPMMPDLTGQEAASMSESLGQEISKLEGVERVDFLRFVKVDAAGQEAVLVARDFKLYDHVPLAVIGGNPDKMLEELRQGSIVVGSVLAEKAKIRLHDKLRVTLGTRIHEFPVAGIATDYTFGGSVAFIDGEVGKRLLDMQGVNSYLIKARPRDLAALEPKLQAIAQREGLLLQSFAELVALIDSMVNGVTGGLWVLLALGLFVGGLGIVNTLTMNVLEQTKELGMLRAIGMRRGQIVKTVIGQAIFLGVIGIGGGIILGVTLARSINITLGTMFGHYVPFALRPSLLIGLIVVGIAIVLFSSLLPGWRAAQLNPIEAMREE